VDRTQKLLLAGKHGVVGAVTETSNALRVKHLGKGARVKWELRISDF
jgi:hypothetical protein